MSASAVLIYGGDPPEPIECSWLAISHCPEGAEAPEGFVLYFLDAADRIQEALQYDTLEAAIGQANILASVEPEAWRLCAVPVPEDGRLRRTDFQI